jgi:hypothetical protein
MHIFSTKLYADCCIADLYARSMQQECAAKLKQTVCQRKNLHRKSLLTAHLSQTVPEVCSKSVPQTVCQKYAASLCHKCARNSVQEKNLHKKVYSQQVFTCSTTAANAL